jgi:hypothetical protein
MRVLDFGEAWTAALAFSFQLFLDFSAYTEMAIGSALLFGLVLPENFRRPYLAADLRDFWRAGTSRCRTFCATISTFRSAAAVTVRLCYALATLITMGCAGCGTGRVDLCGVGSVAWHRLIVCRTWQQLGRPMPALAGWASPCCSCSSAGSCFAPTDLPRLVRSSALSRA